ncbi:MAG: hypothetical protein RLZZ187_2144 [Pseudomonadota bacterium]|jgi:hypothetical protein
MKRARRTPVEGKGVTLAACPMADLARQATALWDALARADQGRRAAVTASEEMRLEREERALYDALWGLEGQASHAQARSIEGAMFAILLARAEFGMLEASDCDDFETTERNRRVVRLLYSALRALEAVSGTPAEEVGAAHYMCRELDPFVMTATALRRAA